eukprot:CAMPEP_0171063488 /NCGR_PEP_ID=MMETSP0766_2-20121228/5693_1 /TAXON_ID=439317 /ORGANISM="Gambierdiscus australes, Strain CAWD 149" /LENGTH=49 /DNA_ID=CAMNT_0011519405 /DNA_START=28 /DNA_END=177 /DNA_ORIENTATION=-
MVAVAPVDSPPLDRQQPPLPTAAVTTRVNPPMPNEWASKLPTREEVQVH